MRVGICYSGIGGGNGADYVAEFLHAAVPQLGHQLVVIGRHGGQEWPMIPECDVIIHSSGFNLTPERVAELRKTAPVILWTYTDEIGFWRQIIEPVSKLVDVHYSYSRTHGFGDHVKYLPLAADETRFYPVGATKKWDVCLSGAKRRWRKEFMDKMAERFNVRQEYSMTLGWADLRSMYAATRVVVAPVQDCDEDVPGRAFGCPCRTFDVPACAAAQIHVKREGLIDCYPHARMIEPMSDVNLAAEVWGDAVAEWLDFPARAAEQAERDYETTLAYHLYRHRLQTMLDRTEFQKVPRE